MIRNPYSLYDMGMGPPGGGGMMSAAAAKKIMLEDDAYCSLNYSDVYHDADYLPHLMSAVGVGGGGGAVPISPPHSSPLLLEGRQYIDPWDLENYAYLQRRIDYGSETETAYSSDCESTSSSQFCYTGGIGMDKQEYYDYLNQRNFMPIETVCDGSCRLPNPDYSIYATSSEYDRPYISREPILEFPRPPPYGPEEDSDAMTLMECQECSLSIDNNTNSYPIYSSSSDLGMEGLYKPINYATTPRHFSLSKKGLLQIDYSCNWNCLDFNFNKMRL